MDRQTDPAMVTDDLVVAYCAPGLKNYATRVLQSNGEHVREVIEHAYMAGRTDIILATDTGDGWLPPEISR
jgi:hypothetical protein